MKSSSLVAALLLTALTSLPASAERASELLAEADSTFRSRRYAAALPLYEAAAEAAGEEGDRSTQTEALAQAARMLSATDRLEMGRPLLERARALARPEEPLGWTRYLGVRGIFERESGDKPAALATFTLMHDEALRLGLPLRAIDAAHHAALVAPAGEQIAWAHRGIAAAEAAGSEAWLAVLWNNLGATYDWDLKDYPKAVECYEKARYFHHLGGDAHAMLVADWALGRAALLAGDLTLAGSLLPAAHEEATRRLAAERTQATLEWAGNTAWWQGEWLARSGEPGESTRHALTLLRQARGHLFEAGMAEWWPEGFDELETRIASLTQFMKQFSK